MTNLFLAADVANRVQLPLPISKRYRCQFNSCAEKLCSCSSFLTSNPPQSGISLPIMVVVAISLIALGALCAAWYVAAARRKRQKAREVLRWIQSALAGRGQVIGISWTSASKFRVPLRLTSGVFHRPSVLVELRSQHNPVQWLIELLRGRREVLTFQADLDFPPAFSLHVNNYRWIARSSRRTPANHHGWKFECLQPLIISTRPEQQKEIACTMASLTRGESSEFLNVSFQRSSPHFSATLLLESLAPGSPSRTYMFDAMRELAGSASASLF